MRNLFAGLCLVAAWSAVPLGAETRNADPSSYRLLLRDLKPGDTLNLAAGKYPRLYLAHLNGTPDAWITIRGPESDPPAVIEGSAGQNTVEIENCSYVSIENLYIDSRGIPGAFGISARGREGNLTHHIRIEGNTLLGQGGGQQTDGISTKTPTWGWEIRFNKILGAGTGLYLGDSDGTQPFVAGVIENNLIKDTIGYNMEIKDQHFIPDVSGMPTGPTSTIIRNNVFIKDDKASPDGDRPNVFTGTFPATGAGSLNSYEIYGNYFVHNHREALYQGSGRLSLHDNIFIDGPPAYAAVVLMKRGQPLQASLVYNNTIYTSGPGIHFDKDAVSVEAVGNLVFASTPIAGGAGRVEDNITGPLESAAKYLGSPSLDPAAADFYPLPGKCQGAPIDLTSFQFGPDYAVDFNGMPKAQAKGTVVFRGAYAGEGQNPGWRLAAAVKPPNPPRRKLPGVVWMNPTAAHPGTRAQLVLTGMNFGDGAAVTVSGDGIRVADTVVESRTQIKAELIIAPGALGPRSVSVETPAGRSNELTLRLGAPERRRK